MKREENERKVRARKRMENREERERKGGEERGR